MVDMIDICCMVEVEILAASLPRELDFCDCFALDGLCRDFDEQCYALVSVLVCMRSNGNHG